MTVALGFTVVCSFIVVFCCIPTASINNERDAIDEFTYHEKAVPHVYTRGSRHKRTTTLTKDGHIDNITIIISAFSNIFTIDLQLNRHLLPKNYMEKYVYKDKEVINTPKDHSELHCYYHGQLRGDADSSAALSTCDGVSGYIVTGGSTYHIEPREGRIYGVHHVYQHSDLIATQLQFEASVSTEQLTGLHVQKLNDVEFESSEHMRKKRSVRLPYKSSKKTKIVELYIVNDYKQYSRLGRNIDKVVKRVKDIVNIVSSLYKPLDIHMALVGVEIWMEHNKIDVIADAHTTMNSFLEYRRAHICPKHPNDNAQLLTRHVFNDGVVGKASIGTMCSSRYSGGVDMDHSELVSVVSTTVAHEIGHNFGLKHDTTNCTCSRDKCIMAPSSGGVLKGLTWSSCSMEEFSDAFYQGMDYCLHNLPAKLHGGSTCGNGFVEDGEQCDCGLPSVCDTKCCDPTTCQLTVNSTCATGQCCDLDTCQVKPAATSCRPAIGVCDLPEFCDGETEYCASDVYKADGAECKYQQMESYCYHGRCPTHEAQCQKLWGKTGHVSHPLCFEYYNKYGTANGHCGFNWVTEKFQRCESEDVMCGMLHCVHTAERLRFWKESLSYTMPYARIQDRNGKTLLCYGAILDVGLDMPPPGMVPEGAKCGDGKVCRQHRCRDVPVVANKPDCHNHGVLNSLGQCHCDMGYAPPDCVNSGSGGSLHSGPTHKDSSPMPVGLIVGLVILFIVILPAIGIIAFLAYSRRDQLKRIWRDSCEDRYRKLCPCCIGSIYKSSPVSMSTITGNKDIRHPNPHLDGHRAPSGPTNLRRKISNPRLQRTSVGNIDHMPPVSGQSTLTGYGVAPLDTTVAGSNTGGVTTTALVPTRAAPVPPRSVKRQPSYRPPPPVPSAPSVMDPPHSRLADRPPQLPSKPTHAPPARPPPPSKPPTGITTTARSSPGVSTVQQRLAQLEMSQMGQKPAVAPKPVGFGKTGGKSDLPDVIMNARHT